MKNTLREQNFKVICAIVNFGIGSKVIKIAQQNGVCGGTILLGKGTVNNRILEFLELAEVRKEIVFIVAEESTANKAIREIDKELDFKKPHHGIAFSLSASEVLGIHNCVNNISEKNGSVENIMYNVIFTVVDSGKAEFVIDAATAAGSKGGTIINARGSGGKEVIKLFSFTIEPEKEIVMILSEKVLTAAIVEAIRKRLDIDEPGKGILFVLDAKEAYGLY